MDKLIKNPSINNGFTIVELLVVIVVIGILAAITVVSYNGIQGRAQVTKMNSDLKMLSDAIMSARINSQKTLMQITGSGWTAGACQGKVNGTDLAALPRIDSCWVNYLLALNSISVASGINVNNMVDPWNRPYAVDENEGEAGGCSQDSIYVFSQPFVSMGSYPGVSISVPLSGLSGCAT
jgi:prepilin-type N-terminal cleavage/methylation domain-containing protein